MSLVQIHQFMRVTGARENLALTATPITDMIDLVLPKYSLLHFVPVSGEVRGFTPDSLLTVNWPNKIRHSFVEDGIFTHGRVMRQKTSLSRHMKEYYKKTPAVTRSRNLDRDMMNERDMLVVDYTLVPRMARYTQAPDVYQNFFANMAETIIDKANYIDGRRPQFIPIYLGNSWATETEFKSCLEEVPAAYRDRFREPALQWVLEIYRMLRGNDSLLNKLVSEDVHFIFSIGLKSVFVSLDVLRYHMDTDERSYVKFHDLIEKLFHLQTASVEEAEEIADEVETEEDRAAKAGIPAGLREQLSERIEAGQMTQAQQLRYARAIADKKDIDSPFGEGRLVEFAQVTKEDVAISADLKSPVNRLMVPESATRSTVANMRSKYVKDVLQKDIANVFLSLDRGGAILRSYSSTTIVDALEETQIIRVSILPVNGRESTFEIELPVFHGDGTFTMSGIRYTMDAQKVD